jgi:uncharacterized Ntn-hydrolase superfamily protein
MSARSGTFSILARDRGVLGAASASGSIAVGERVIHAGPGVGVVVTQGYTRVSYGPRGLELMAGGVSPKDALKHLLSGDAGRELRQVALINSQGKMAVHTGARIPAYRGQAVGEDYVAIGNLLAGEGVVNAMVAAFEKFEGNLGERMVEVLKAGHEAGGDRRGERSAALVVVDSKKVRIRLDVRDHPSPIEELEKLLKGTTVACR